MPKQDRALCIGGPLAGQSHRITGARLAALGRTSEGYREVYYRLETFAAPEGAVHLWVLSSMTLLEVVHGLVDAYQAYHTGRK